jgi:CrcB protein
VLNTLLPNLLGVFALAFLLCEAGSILSRHADVLWVPPTGLLGAFTTFSTLCKEIILLLQAGEFAAAAGYAALSVFAGFWRRGWGQKRPKKLPTKQ